MDCEEIIDPEAVVFMNNPGQLFEATCRLSEAEPLMRRALEIFTESLGEEHPHTRAVAGNLAGLLRALEEKKE